MRFVNLRGMLDSAMDLAPLPSIILAITEQRSLCAVLATIVDSVARQPNVALARLWLRQSDRECPHCCRSAQDSGESLHLRASSGTSQVCGAAWSRTDGSFHQIVLGRPDSKISHIATSG